MMDTCSICGTKLTSLTRGLFRTGTTGSGKKGKGHQVTTWHHLEDGHDDHRPQPTEHAPKKRTTWKTATMTTGRNRRNTPPRNAPPPAPARPPADPGPPLPVAAEIGRAGLRRARAMLATHRTERPNPFAADGPELPPPDLTPDQRANWLAVRAIRRAAAAHDPHTPTGDHQP